MQLLLLSILFLHFCNFNLFYYILKTISQPRHLLHIDRLIYWRSLFIPNSLILVITNLCLNLYHSDIYLISHGIVDCNSSNTTKVDG